MATRAAQLEHILLNGYFSSPNRPDYAEVTENARYHRYGKSGLRERCGLKRGGRRRYNREPHDNKSLRGTMTAMKRRTQNGINRERAIKVKSNWQ
jgi:hypothetical protein